MNIRGKCQANKDNLHYVSLDKTCLNRTNLNRAEP